MEYPVVDSTIFNSDNDDNSNNYCKEEEEELGDAFNSNYHNSYFIGDGMTYSKDPLPAKKERSYLPTVISSTGSVVPRSLVEDSIRSAVRAESTK